MRRQRPLRYTVALFAAAAVGVVASPSARAAADDDASTAPTLPVHEPETSAPRAPADESGHGSTAPPDTKPDPSTASPTTTASTTTPPTSVPPTTTPSTTAPTTTTPSTSTTTTTLPPEHAGAPTTPVTAEPAPPAATDLAPVGTPDVAVPPAPTPSDTKPAPDTDTDELDGPTGIDGITRPITFPVLGPVSYSNGWGDCRDGCTRHHQGTDILGVRMQPLLAAVDGTVTRVRLENAGIAGVVITVTGDDGWYYNYFHVNDDTPGTDDGLADPEWQVSPGLTVGSRVRAGQVIGYMGDSGNAESSVPHLHFEIRTPDHTPANPYQSLVAAQRRGTCAGGDEAWTNAALDTLSPSAVAVISLAGSRWVIDEDGRLYAEGSAARLQPAAGVACDNPVPAAPVAAPARQAPSALDVAAPADVTAPAPTTARSDAPLPVDPPASSDAPQPSLPAPTGRRWTVEPGDCLWDIVQTSYGTADVDATVALVDFVFEHNRDQLTSPSVLHIGTTLELPTLTF